MISKNILSFLNKLKDNNNREWFAENKKEYEKAKLEFEDYANKLIPAIAAFDKNITVVPAKDVIFRIYRDTRFSKDKTPYKLNFGAFITGKTKDKGDPGYYFHIEPGHIMIAGGTYMPQPDALKKIRQEIFYNIDDFLKIIDNKEFKKQFNGLFEEDNLKKVPKEFPADFKYGDLLKFKHYTVIKFIDEKEMYRDDFLQESLKVYKSMKPLNDFIRKAVND